MSGQWKPGQVALVDTTLGDGRRIREIAFRRDTGGWYLERGHYAYDADVRDVQPLLVIKCNSDAPRLLEQAANALRQRGRHAAMYFCHDLADEIRKQLPNRKPVEPLGLGAVVEDVEGHLWLRWSRGEGCVWRSAEQGFDAHVWDAIAAVKVLSPGWSAES